MNALNLDFAAVWPRLSEHEARLKGVLFTQGRPSGLSEEAARFRVLEGLLSEHAQLLDELGEMHDVVLAASETSCDVEQAVRRIWGTACGQMVNCRAALAEGGNEWSTEHRVRYLSLVQGLSDRLAELIRTMAVAWPDLDLELPTDIAAAVWTIRIPPLAYLRSMWSLFWSALRHPLSESTIDLSTGRVLYRT